MNYRTIKKIDKKVSEIEESKEKYRLNTKIIYNKIWKEIIKNMSESGIDIELSIRHERDGYMIHNISTVDYLKSRYIDLEKLERMLMSDGIVMKECLSFSSYNWRIVYTLEEIKEILNNKKMEIINSKRKNVLSKKLINDEEKGISYTKNIKSKNYLNN
ncbi:MAG: hypothetical protein IJ094_01995 [Bacilli bacterium]|nr:hypothetical protein [Bacilli bacterium]